LAKPKNFWIVNNPYHLNDIELFNTKYQGDNFFISIIHRPINFKGNVDVTYIKRYNGCFSFFLNFLSLRNKIHKLDIKSSDRIFLFNGQELMNNVVLSVIYKKYSKNIFLVDDGSSTYIFYLGKVEKSSKISHRIKKSLLSFFIGVEVNYTYACKLHYISLHEKYVKKILFPYKIFYNGPIEVESFERKFYNLDNSDGTTTIFLSQPFYLKDPGYISYEDYVKLLNTILERLKRRYRIVYFKSHPNDYIELESHISNEDKKVVFLNKIVPFEDIFRGFSFSTLYSFNSNSLLYSFGSGKTTIWLFNLISEQCKSDFSYLNYVVSINGGKIINQIDEL
jgi:hypothetical protein